MVSATKQLHHSSLFKQLLPAHPYPYLPLYLWIPLFLSLPEKLIQEEEEVGGAGTCAEKNLHDPKMPCLSSDSINQRDGENPPTPPFFVLKGDKLIPGWLISRGTGRPKLPQDLCGDKWIYIGGNVSDLKNKIYLLFSATQHS